VAERAFYVRTRTSVTSSASPESVFDVVSDLQAHLIWSGERAADQTFKLLSLEAPRAGSAAAGTEFSSTGANFNGTFNDRSVVTHAERPSLFVIETDARLDRKRGQEWHVHFIHRYDIISEGTGSRITYTETIDRVNYVPWWLSPWLRPIFRPIVNRADRKQLANLAKLAEERSPGELEGAN
jgi:polyketide cyclase/dehydrase/lipid transport protein